MEIPIELVDDNPFNSRLEYELSEIQSLADSLSANGLLCPIKVRRCENKDRFQIIYGHRRVRAARLLNWLTIKGEVDSSTDIEMVSYSLIENLARKDLSDYEKAVSISRLHKDHHLSFEKIGELVGYSKTHVFEYASMLCLFDEETILKNSWIKGALLQISEHHARILRRTTNIQTRINLLRLVTNEGLSVRDLQRMLQKLSGLFEQNQSQDAEKDFLYDENELGRAGQGVNEDEVSRVESIIRAKFALAQAGDFETYSALYNRNTLSALSSFFPSDGFVEKKKAIKVQKNWFYSVAPKFSCRLRDIHTQIFGKVAVVTLIVEYERKVGSKFVRRSSCGTCVLNRWGKEWKIVHEHYSKLETPIHHSDRSIKRPIMA